MADGKNPLLSVKRIVQRGNLVQFGDHPGESFIYNKESQKKLMLHKNGRGSYVLLGQFKGGGRTEATVDSAAEESVCPPWWGQQFGIRGADEWMNFTVANGGKAHHYGQRDVQIEAEGFF